MTTPMNLIGQQQLIICSKALPTNNISVCTNCLMSIPISVPSYSLITWDNTANYRNILRSKNVKNIDIQIYDQYGNFINFNGCNWQITLRIGIFRNIVFHSNELIPTDLFTAGEE
jgi:hypothetical protein